MNTIVTLCVSTIALALSGYSVLFSSDNDPTKVSSFGTNYGNRTVLNRSEESVEAQEVYVKRIAFLENAVAEQGLLLEMTNNRLENVLKEFEGQLDSNVDLYESVDIGLAGSDEHLQTIVTEEHFYNLPMHHEFSAEILDRLTYAINSEPALSTISLSNVNCTHEQCMVSLQEDFISSDPTDILESQFALGRVFATAGLTGSQRVDSNGSTSVAYIMELQKR